MTQFHRQCQPTSHRGDIITDHSDQQSFTFVSINPGNWETRRIKGMDGFIGIRIMATWLTGSQFGKWDDGSEYQHTRTLGYQDTRTPGH